MKKICPTCKKGFLKPLNESLKNWNTRRKYCSRECNRTSIRISCLMCMGDIYVTPYKINHGGGKYCSNKCKNRSTRGKPPWNKGKTGIYSEATLTKIRLARQRQIISLDTRRKMSIAMKISIKVRRGKDHWAYKTGKSDTARKKVMRGLQYRLWRAAVFKRDNYTCQECGVRGGQLEADHIKPWALYVEFRYILDNGRTLCVQCHRKTETWGYQKIYTFTP